MSSPRVLVSANTDPSSPGSMSPKSDTSSKSTETPSNTYSSVSDYSEPSRLQRYPSVVCHNRLGLGPGWRRCSCRAIFEKLFVIFTCLFRIRQWRFERQIKVFNIVSVSTVLFTCCVVAVIWEVIVDFEKVADDAQKGVFNSRVIGWIASSLVSGMLTLNTAAFVCFRQTQLMVFGIILIMTVTVNFYHFFGCRQIGVYQGSPFFAMLIILIVGYKFGNPFQFVVWGIIFVMDVIVATILDTVLITKEKIIQYFLSVEEGYLTELTFGFYFVVICVCGMTMLVLIFEKFRMMKDGKIVDTIGDCILTLDFSGNYCKQFEQRKESTCNQIERLFKNIIFNLKTYKSYLPDAIRHGQKNDDDEEEEEEEQCSEGEKRIPRTSPASSCTSSSNLSRNSSFVESVKFSANLAIGNRRIVDYSLNFRDEVVLLLFKASFDYREIEERKLIEFSQMYVDTVSAKTLGERGVVNEISSDGSEILCSFNAVKRSINSATKAVSIACKVLETLRNEFPMIKLGACVVENLESIVGNLKSSIGGIAQFYILGKHSEILERMLTMQDDRYAVLVNTLVFRKCKYLFEFKQIDYDEYIDVGIFQVERQLVNNNKYEEWMYQIGSRIEKGSVAEKSSGFQLTQIWSEYMKRNYEVAWEKLLEYQRENHSDKDIMILRRRLNEQMCTQIQLSKYKM